MKFVNEQNPYMFQVPFYNFKLEEWEEKKKIILDHYESLGHRMEKDDLMTTNYHSDLNELNSLPPQIFTEELHFLTKQFCKKNYTIDGCWFEKTERGQRHPIHNHGFSCYSAVCFIEFDKNVHKPTVFISPFNNFLTGNLLDYIPNDVEESSLIFFPAVIHHYTIPNNSDKERLILSFNVKFF